MQVRHVEHAHADGCVAAETPHVAVADIAVGGLQIVLVDGDVDALDPVVVRVIVDISVEHAIIVGQPVFGIEIVLPQPFLAQIDITRLGIRIVVLVVVGGDEIGEAELQHDALDRAAQLQLRRHVVAQIHFRLEELEVPRVVEVAGLADGRGFVQKGRFQRQARIDDPVVNRERLVADFLDFRYRVGDVNRNETADGLRRRPGAGNAQRKGGIEHGLGALRAEFQIHAVTDVESVGTADDAFGDQGIRAEKEVFLFPAGKHVKALAQR